MKTILTKRQAEKLLKLFGPNGENWIKGASARNADNYICDPCSEDACKFCLWGAAKRLDLMEIGIMLTGTFADLNDAESTTWADIEALILKATKTRVGK